MCSLRHIPKKGGGGGGGGGGGVTELGSERTPTDFQTHTYACDLTPQRREKGTAIRINPLQDFELKKVDHLPSIETSTAHDPSVSRSERYL